MFDINEYRNIKLTFWLRPPQREHKRHLKKFRLCSGQVPPGIPRCQSWSRPHKIYLYFILEEGKIPLFSSFTSLFDVFLKLLSFPCLPLILLPVPETFEWILPELDFTRIFTGIRNIQLKSLRHSGYTTYINTTRTGQGRVVTGSCCVNICRIPTVP